MDWLKYKVKIGSSQTKETIISSNSYFEGTMESPNTIIIEGCYVGNTLKAEKVIISKGAIVKTNVYADTFVLQGTLIGNAVINTRIILEPNSKLSGNITSPELISSEGVLFEGTCKIAQNNNNPGSINKTIQEHFQEELRNYTTMHS